MSWLHPSLRLTTADRCRFATIVEMLNSLGGTEYSERVRRLSLHEFGIGGWSTGEHRFVVCVGDRWGSGWMLKWGDPQVGMERNNQTELETYATLTESDDPVLRAMARRHLVPVYDLGKNVLACPAILECAQDEDVMPELGEIAQLLNIPDVHPGNAGWMLQPDGTTALAVFDYGYCLTPLWRPEVWPQGAESAPLDVQAYWQARRESDARGPGLVKVAKSEV